MKEREVEERQMIKAYNLQMMVTRVWISEASAKKEKIASENSGSGQEKTVLAQYKGKCQHRGGTKSEPAPCLFNGLEGEL